MKLLLAVLLLTCALAPGHAADLPQAKLDEYLTVSKFDAKYQTTIELYYANTLKDYPYLKNVKAEYFDLMKEMLPYDQCRELTVKSLRDNLSEDDLDALLRFAHSDTGQKMVTAGEQFSAAWSGLTFAANFKNRDKMSKLFKKAYDIETTKM